MDGLLTALLVLVIDLYIIMLFVRIFTLERERYDSMLGLVFRATDPLLLQLRPLLPWRSVPITILIIIGGLLLIKGLLGRSIPLALRGMADTLLQLYVLIILITATVREYYINPLINLAQRLVRPVYMMARQMVAQPLAVYALSVGLLVIAHALIRLALREVLGSEGPAMLMGRETFIISSLRLIVDLTVFFTYVIIINALLSWVSPDPMNPIVQLLSLIAAPITDPVRRVVPPLGGVLDLSPLVALLLLQLGNGILHNLLNVLEHSLG
jgi:YggT family protein